MRAINLLTKFTIMSKIKKILLSQPRPTTERSPYFDLEKKYGVKIDFQPLIRIEELTPKEFRAQHLNPMDYTAVLFNSRLGVDHYFHLCSEMRLRIPETMHYYCQTEAIANYMQKFVEFRKRRIFFSENNRWEDLIPPMQRRPKEKFMMVLSDIHNDDVIRMFAAKRIQIDPAVMYRTVSVVLEGGMDYDMVVLFTPAGVKALSENAAPETQGERILACFGANTVQTAQSMGYRVDIEAPNEKYQSIAPAIEDFLKAQKKR